MLLTGAAWLLAAEIGLAVLVVTSRSKMLLQLSRLLSKFAPAVVPQSLPEAVRKQLKQPPV